MKVKVMENEAKPQNTCELAKSLNQAICARITGPMYAVYYPYRKSGDMYVAIEGYPIHCCQCEQDIPVDDSLKAWREHIRKHARRKLVNPIIFADIDNDGKPYVAQEKQVCVQQG